MRKLDDLRHSQLVGVKKIVENPACMLGMAMGLGKTGTALTAFRELLDTFQVTHILVIAPLLVAEETWPDEIDAWEHTSVLDYEVLTGPPDRREQRARRLPEVSIINTENVGWLVEFWGDDWPYDMVCIDEISRFKNPSKKTKPTKVAVQKAMDEAMRELPKGLTDEQIDAAVKKAVKKVKGNPTRFGALCSVRKRILRVIGLTGTMSPNGLLDIWSQFYLLDQGERLYGSFNQYRTRWFDSDYMGYRYTPRPGAFEQIVERIQDITLSMKTEDYVDMPPVIHNTIRVKLPPKVMAQYRKFEKTMLLEEHDIEAVNEGVLTGKLLQLANGSVYDEDGNVIEIHSLKLDALDSVIEEANGAPVLVAYSYQFDLEKLRKRYPKAEVVGEAPNLQKRWNNGEISILLAHPQSAGHGLNLQYGGCITVWYGLCWSLEYYQQLNKRLHRPGQKETVVIHHIVAEGTVDERVMAVLPEKDALQDALVEATKYREAS
ncbi:DEAD/DEAH box helicase [Stutzerimonas nitrititolerans]|uniref:DEAD/DEAH box helicase n=1 Tax=Stutzerimonas nitrititolerans TaxID=2482751 RepID=UPI00289E543E|nr:DEAD/DEAH box helicase [Stutzerimonas nitrititolerans]